VNLIFILIMYEFEITSNTLFTCKMIVFLEMEKTFQSADKSRVLEDLRRPKLKFFAFW
jgi:hypothetical protein